MIKCLYLFLHIISNLLDKWINRVFTIYIDLFQNMSTLFLSLINLKGKCIFLNIHYFVYQKASILTSNCEFTTHTHKFKGLFWNRKPISMISDIQILHSVSDLVL